MAHVEDLTTTSFDHDDRFHEALSELILIIQPYSEDLYEEENYLEKRWLQIEQDPVASRLHIFREDENYIESIDGNILSGKWSIMEDSNTLILSKPSRAGTEEKTLYDLAFLNEDFFILKKHGKRKNMEMQYLLLGREGIVDGKSWEEVIDLIYERYRNNKRLITGTIIAAAFVLLYIVFRYA